MAEKATILIVDDNPQNLQVLAEVVEKSGSEAVLALDGRQALAYIEDELPDLILLDVMMPEMDGYVVCHQLKEQASTCSIPVIFITAKTDSDDIVKGFAAGGVDYVTKPFRVPELQARLRTHLALKRYQDELRENHAQLQQAYCELQAAHDTIASQNSQLKEMLEQVQVYSRTDALTGLYNRRYMMEKLNAEVARYRRSQRPFVLISGDIDFFKTVNDSYGHDCGDRVLQGVARVMKSLLREQDSLARWGGEEFLVLLPETEAEHGLQAAERIRAQVGALKVREKQSVISVAMTLGVAEFGKEDTIDTTLKRADDALYRGKRQGRNQVVCG